MAVLDVVARLEHRGSRRRHREHGERHGVRTQRERKRWRVRRKLSIFIFR